MPKPRFQGDRSRTPGSGSSPDGAPRSFAWRAAFVALLVPVALVSGGCGSNESPPSPEWIDLARGFHPRPLQEVAGEWLEAEGRPELSLAPHDDGEDVWIDVALPASAWTRAGASGEWQTARPRGGVLDVVPPRFLRLTHPERTFTRKHGTQAPVEGEFLVEGESLFVKLGPDETPPEGIAYGVRLDRGRSIDGVWRVVGKLVTADGIPVFGGSSESIETRIPPRSALRVTARWAEGEVEGAGVLRVLLDGRPLEPLPALRGVGTRAPDGTGDLVFELPAEGAELARFTFEATGPPHLALFVDPMLTPRDVGTYAERPWAAPGKRRPDLVLFLADTFRADNMKAFGGEKELTPNLDAWASRSVRFRQARATASWTLPSISSMLTGLHPGQHAAVDDNLTLSRELTTIAETFARQGYRTAAVTDAAFFSRGYGLDQGFQRFVEHDYPDWDATRTVDDARRLLDLDDGRPLFLVVHSYRAHAPYRLGPDEDRTGWEDLIRLGTEMLENDEVGGPKPRQRIFLSLSERFEELYDDGVRDLDAEFGRFVGDLESRAILEHGYLAFTSDHGEAFGEHDAVSHGNVLWDVMVRVPLVIHGGGLAPRDVDWSVSLVDLAPTFAGLAGIAGESAWDGTSMLDADADRRVYSFLLEKVRAKKLTLVEGPRKVFATPDPEALERGEFARAYDLASDPDELEALGADVEWTIDLCRDSAARVRALLEPLVEPDELGLAGERPNLAEIGYGDG